MTDAIGQITPAAKRAGRWSAALTGLVVALALGLALLLAPWPIRVVDGDTIDRGLWRYRLLGFDAAETRRPRAKCEAEIVAGRAAAARLTEIIASAQRVELIGSLWRRDRWGRVLARLELDGADAATIAISEGWGAPYSGRGPRHNWC